MADTKTAAEVRYHGLIAQLPCIICARFDRLNLPVEVHHIAEGSSPRNHWLVAPLCGCRTDGGHHRGATGLHGMGLKTFLSFYHVPHLSEYGLLAWAQEDLIFHLSKGLIRI